jgi:hypothetical protein
MAECVTVLYFLFSGFTVKWTLPQGIDGGAGRICIGDTDRDSFYEFIIRTYGGSQKIYFYELHIPNSWEIDSFSYLYSAQPWDIGDFDIDGLSDLVIQASATAGFPTMVISVAESPDSLSYSIQEVWRDTVDIGVVQPICAFDIDKDGIPEIVQTGGEAGTNYYIDFSIYESIGDNTYEIKYSFESPETPTSTVAFGDFDADSFNEFVLGTIDGQYSIFESPANDSYVPLFVNIQLPTANIKDCFSVADADGDGKLEFVVKGFTVLDGKIQAYIFEATGDNTYAIIKAFDIAGGSFQYGGGYSEAGDVDGDSVPEIVLEACQSIYIIKSAGNDSFYVWQTLTGNQTGSSIRVTNDLDGNGLNEIVISGNNQTRIYEYEPGSVTEEASQAQEGKLKVFPNPFTEELKIEYHASEPRHRISLKLYDVSGRIVKILYDCIADGGNTLTWHGDDETGKIIPAGIYFLRVENTATNETFCRKILKIE